MRRLGYLFLVSICWLLTTPLSAVELGTVSVPLASQSQQDIDTAERAALTQLLIQITGRQSVDGLPGIDGILTDSAKYLTQYGHERDDDELLLTASFDVQSVVRRLQEAGAPVWSLSRPAVLLWLVDGTTLVTGEREVIDEQAKHRGLPLLFPSSVGQVTPADIRGRFMEAVIATSRSYPADLVATAIVYPGANYEIRWWLYQQDTLIEQGSESGSELSDAEVALVNRLTNVIASRYAVSASASDDDLRVSVSRLTGLSAWHQADQYLQGLAGMKAANTVQVRQRQVVWKLDFSGDTQRLRRLLLLNRHLKECDLPMTKPRRETRLESNKVSSAAPRSVVDDVDSERQLKAEQASVDTEVKPLTVESEPAIALSFCWRE